MSTEVTRDIGIECSAEFGLILSAEKFKRTIAFELEILFEGFSGRNGIQVYGDTRSRDGEAFNGLLAIVGYFDGVLGINFNGGSRVKRRGREIQDQQATDEERAHDQGALWSDAASRLIPEVENEASGRDKKSDETDEKGHQAHHFKERPARQAPSPIDEAAEDEGSCAESDG